MNFTKAVIGANYAPVGFVYEDRGREYFEDFNRLCRRNASDGRLTFSESGVFGLYKYTENGVKVCRETADGGYSAPIDPGIFITKRVISGGKTVGYTLKDCTGAEVNKRIESVLSAAKYLQPMNFKVVTRGSQQILQGKDGTVLGALPSVDVTPLIKTPARPKTTRVEAHDVVDPRLVGGTPLVRLFEEVRGCEGSVLKFPGDEYAPVGEMQTTDGDGFLSVKACEIAPSILYASSKKLSASLKYKRPGAVMVNGMMVLAYVHRDKNVINVHYENGVLRGDKVRLGRVGFAIPSVNAEKFYQAMAGTVAVQPSSDALAAKSAVQLAKIADPVILEADVGELPILGARFTDYLYSGEALESILQTIYKYKYVAKYLAANMPQTSRAPKTWGSYSSYDSATLAALSEVVDISTGIYKGKGTESTNRHAVAKEANAEIVYELTNADPIPKEADLVSVTVSALPAGVAALVAPTVAAEGHATGIKEAKAAAAGLELVLLKHKLAMVADGNNLVHSHDASEWNLPSKPVSSRAQFTKYEHPAGVTVTLRNISKA
ncbi:hypothetical protein FACS1894208_02090 [Clostridia bacterium]|nr:hypothetical protein FACS1894208_02090 [Clostridia bacterium]